MPVLTTQLKTTFKDAAKKLTGAKKRAFIAQVALDYFDGSARKTEREIGWWRVAVQRGLDTLATGMTYEEQYHQRGRKKTEEHLPNIVKDIRDLIDADCQADPKFQTSFQYCRVSARAVREKLITEKGYQEQDLPSRQTIGALLNRWGYRLKKHSSSNP